MSRHALLSIGLALLAATAAPTPVFAASPSATPEPAATSKHPDVVYNNVFIFFRNADTTLTPLMLKQVTRAAELAKQGGATRIKITGYSDDPKHPETYGQARADVLKAALVKEGIAESMIETQARAKQPPGKAAGPNPANRRARISLIRAFTAAVGPHDGAR